MPINPYFKGGADVAVSDGGTNASDAPTALVNLNATLSGVLAIGNTTGNNNISIDSGDSIVGDGSIAITGSISSNLLNVGIATSAIALGDLSAGDGTNELSYDASVGRLYVEIADAATDTVTIPIRGAHRTSATVVAGFGTAIVVDVQDDNGDLAAAFLLIGEISDPAAGNFTTDLRLQLKSNGSTANAAKFRGSDLTLRLEGGLEVGASTETITNAGDIVAGGTNSRFRFRADIGKLEIERADDFIGIASVLQIEHSLLTATAGVGTGTSIIFNIEDDTGFLRSGPGILAIEWLNATPATMSSMWSFEGYTNGRSLKRFMTLSSGNLTVNESDEAAGPGVNRTWITSDGWMVVGRNPSVAGLGDGDIVAGDGTREVFWDASTGIFRITDTSNGISGFTYSSTGNVAITKDSPGNDIKQTLTLFGFNSSGNGGVGLGCEIAFHAEDDTGGHSHLSRITGVLRNAPVSSNYADMLFEARRNEVDTEFLRIGNSQAGTGAGRVEMPNGGLMVGTIASITASAQGDIVAGDSTRELNWDASAGTLDLTGLTTNTSGFGAIASVADFFQGLLVLNSNSGTNASAEITVSDGTAGGNINATGVNFTGDGGARAFRINSSSQATGGMQLISTNQGGSKIGFWTNSSGSNTKRWEIVNAGHLLTATTGIDIGSTTDANQPRDLHLNRALNVGDVTASTSTGDFTAGDGTSLFTWDASTARFQIIDGSTTSTMDWNFNTSALRLVIVPPAANTVNRILHMRADPASPPVAGHGISFEMSGGATASQQRVLTNVTSVFTNISETTSQASDYVISIRAAGPAIDTLTEIMRLRGVDSVTVLAGDLEFTNAASISGLSTITISSTGILSLDSTTNAIETNATTFTADAALTITATSAILSLDGTGIETSATTFTADAGLSIVTTTTGALSLDSGTTGDVSLGTGGSAKSVTVGSTNSTSTLTLQSGTGAMTFTAGGIFDVNATGAVTIDSSSTIAVGATAGTAIQIGRAGLTEDLQLVDGTGVNINSTLDGDGDGTVFVQQVQGNVGFGLVLDSASGTTLNATGIITIGDATGTSIQIGRATLTNDLQLVDGTRVDINSTLSGGGDGTLQVATVQGTSLTINSTGTLSLDSTTGLIQTDATALTADAGLAISTTTTGTLSLDSGTTGDVSLGTGASAKTITIGNTTGATAVIIDSGSAGITLQGDLETVLTANAASLGTRSNTELLATTAGATVTTSGLIPAGVILVAVVARVTTTVVTSSATDTFDVGDSGDADRYGLDIAGASGTTVDQTDYTADPTGVWSASAREIILDAAAAETFTAGAVRVTAFYRVPTAPTS